MYMHDNPYCLLCLAACSVVWTTDKILLLLSHLLYTIVSFSASVCGGGGVNL